MAKKNVSQAQALASRINSEIGEGALLLGSDSRFTPERIPTGSLVLDRITGGGFVKGRHVELFGDEHSCKTLIAYRTMALAQARGSLCAMVDAEKTYDSTWFRRVGGDPKTLLLFQPDVENNADAAIATMMLLAQEAAADILEVVTVDSVAAMVPREDIQRDPRQEDRMGSQARMMSRALRKITTVNQNCLFIWINQERMNIGVRFGNPRTTSGGRALGFYATTRIEFRKTEQVKVKKKVADSRRMVTEKDRAVGTWIQVRSVKDKSTRPYGQGLFIFDNRTNQIDRYSEIVHLGLEDELLVRRGNSIYYEDIDGKEWKSPASQFGKLLSVHGELEQELVDAIEDRTREGDYEQTIDV